MARRATISSTSRPTSRGIRRSGSAECRRFRARTTRRKRRRNASRNSGRSPWTNTVNLSLRQALPAVRGQSFSVQLDVFNFLNLLNRDWGQQPLPPLGGGSVPLLTHVAHTPGG